MFFRKIVAEFEGTMTQIMGKFRLYALNGYGQSVLSLRLLAEVSTLSLLAAAMCEAFPGEREVSDKVARVTLLCILIQLWDHLASDDLLNQA